MAQVGLDWQASAPFPFPLAFSIVEKKYAEGPQKGHRTGSISLGLGSAFVLAQSELSALVR